MVWWTSKEQQERRMSRPSEINGCQVQHVSYLDEIDDENVLQALDKLRRRKLTIPAAKLAAVASSSSTHKPQPVHLPPPVAPLSPESSVASVTSQRSTSLSILSGEEKQGKKSSTTKNWLQNTFSNFACLGAIQETSCAAKSSLANHISEEEYLEKSFQANKNHRCNSTKKEVSKQPVLLNDLEEEFLHGDEETFFSQSLASTQHSKATIRELNSGSLKMKLKAQVVRFLENAGAYLMEGDLDGEDTVTLYAYNDHGYDFTNDNSTFGETTWTLETQESFLPGKRNIEDGSLILRVNRDGSIERAFVVDSKPLTLAEETEVEEFFNTPYNARKNVDKEKSWNELLH